MCCKPSSEFKSIFFLLLLTLLLPFSAACVQLCVCVCVSVFYAPLRFVCALQTFAKNDTRCKTAQWLHGSTAPRLHGCMASQRWCVSLLRHAPPCSLTKSINTMQAQHDEHEADEGTRTHWGVRHQPRVRGRVRVRVGTESRQRVRAGRSWSHCCCLRGSCYVPTLSYIKGGAG